MQAVREWTGAEATALRKALRMTEPRFATVLRVSKRTVSNWSAQPETVPRPDAQELLDDLLTNAAPEVKIRFAGQADGMALPPSALLGKVPQSFPAASLSGSWVTAYQFTHGDQIMHHADIAHLEADDDGQIRARNHPPEPRTEGRATPFHNEIEGRLFSRHLLGTWKNTSDARYFGTIHLAVLPGEIVMDGFYTGYGSDISVSTGRWRWVRVDGEALSTVMLREPSVVYDAVMRHSQDAAPLTLADIAEESNGGYEGTRPGDDCNLYKSLGNPRPQLDRDDLH
jgi:hypothetical protein